MSAWNANTDHYSAWTGAGAEERHKWRVIYEERKAIERGEYISLEDGDNLPGLKRMEHWDGYWLPGKEVVVPRNVVSRVYNEDTRKPCAVCGREIPSERSEQAITCGTRCANIREFHSARTKRANQKQKQVKTIPQRTCITCGGAIHADRKNSASTCSHFCSKKNERDKANARKRAYYARSRASR